MMLHAHARRLSLPFGASCVAALLAVGMLQSCNRADADKAAAPPPPPPPVPVAVATVQSRDMPIRLRSVGTVESISSITMRPQISGLVMEVPAGEGGDVEARDVLVRIDPRPFEAALREAEASLAKNVATAEDQRRAAQALRAAAQGRAVSTREAEQSEAQAAAAEAQVGEDKAVIETARLNLSYCTITAPFAGRLGALYVKPGAVVKVNETDLIDLTAMAPIDVSFAIREEDLTAVRAARAAGAVPARTFIPGVAAPVEGSLSFIDSRVDPASGTVRLKARFTNEDLSLWPGLFVNVELTIGTDQAALVVPSSAVQSSQRGSSIFVVKPDSTVDLRLVDVKRTTEGFSVIAPGAAAAGDTVVTDGQLRLVPGSRIAVKGAGAPAKPDPKPETPKPDAASPAPAGDAR